mmetsp:Transcript_62525/g.173290  ORF Transcript_62525/g.173290 Transcript_62525/m.173290 type:complete len:299 (-) Transcript_62525:112-1008(-)
MEYFRVRRGIAVAALLLEGAGQAPLATVLSRVHRPPELAELEAEERAAPHAQALSARPPGGGYGHQEYGGTGAGASAGSAPPEAEPLALMISVPPAWVEAWVQEYFQVHEGTAFFLPERRKPAPERTPEMLCMLRESVAEEEAVLMQVQEELRLRYGRAHSTTLMGCFEGVRQKWLQHFYDVTKYGDVISKSVARQTREAIAICRRMAAYGGTYSAAEAFREFGATQQWLRAHFHVADDGTLGLDDADPWRAWHPPPKDPAPSPWSYARLRAPRGYIRKGNGRYLPRKYGHHAGGILY